MENSQNTCYMPGVLEEEEEEEQSLKLAISMLATSFS